MSLFFIFFSYNYGVKVEYLINRAAAGGGGGVEIKWNGHEYVWFLPYLIFQKNDLEPSILLLLSGRRPRTRKRGRTPQPTGPTRD